MLLLQLATALDEREREMQVTSLHMKPLSPTHMRWLLLLQLHSSPSLSPSLTGASSSLSLTLCPHS